MAEKITAEEAGQLKAATQEPSGDEPGGLSPEKGLEILGPEPETFDTTIGKITIAPMNMGQVKQFMSVSDVLVPAILQKLKEDDNRLDFGALFRVNPAAFCKAMSIATNRTEAELDNLLPHEYIRLATKVVVVNMDFFVQTLPTVYGAARASLLLGLANWLGVSQSNG